MLILFFDSLLERIVRIPVQLEISRQLLFIIFKLLHDPVNEEAAAERAADQVEQPCIFDPAPTLRPVVAEPVAIGVQ